MAEVDTSSYPKPPALPAQKSVLDQVGQFQQLESNQLSISKQKLDQANQAMGYMTRAMSSLGPNASKEDYLAVGQNAVKMGLVPPNMLGAYVERLQKAPSSRAFYDEFVTAAATHQQTLDYHLGRQDLYNTGQSDVPVAVSPKFGIRSSGLPIQRQAAPTTKVIDTNETLPNGEPNPNYNRETLQGPTRAITPEGTEQVPGGIPGQYRPVAGSRLPIQPNPVQTQRILPTDRNMNLTGPDRDVTGIDVQNVPPNQVVQNRFPSPSGPAVGQAPLFGEGLKAYTGAQLSAGAKAQALKPLIQAIPLMQTPGFLSGPLTDQFTKAVAGLKSTGIISIADENDPTAIRQEAVKKLNQYLSNSPVAQRSDAAQTLKEAGSPHPNVQILPALIKLAKDQIALDRIEIAMPNAFKSKNYQDFLKHQGTFPQSVDERAFVLDQEPEEKSKSLVDKMAEQTKSKNNRERMEAEKFFKSLTIADEQGFYK